MVAKALSSFLHEYNHDVTVQRTNTKQHSGCLLQPPGPHCPGPDQLPAPLVTLAPLGLDQEMPTHLHHPKTLGSMADPRPSPCPLPPQQNSAHPGAVPPILLDLFQ
jgi:hypothetical protein